MSDFFKECRQRMWGIPEGVEFVLYCLQFLLIGLPTSIESLAGVKKVIPVFLTESTVAGRVFFCEVKLLEICFRGEVVRPKLVVPGVPKVILGLPDLSAVPCASFAGSLVGLNCQGVNEIIYLAFLGPVTWQRRSR